MDMHRASLDLEKSLIQLGHIPKVIVPSGNQTNLIIAYAAINKRVPVNKQAKKLSKIVRLIL
jgi:threonine synthase